MQTGYKYLYKISNWKMYYAGNFLKMRAATNVSLCVCVCVCRRNLNYFSSAYTAAVSAVDPDAGHGELVIKIPSEIWKQGDGNILLLLDYK